MKQFIWRFIIQVFNKEIHAKCVEFCNTENQIFSKKQRQEKRRSTVYNYPIGSKVIVRSNQPDDLLIGHVIRHEDMGESREILLVIKDEKSGEEFMPLDNSPMHWSKEAEDALLKLNWVEQWNVMGKGNHILDQEYKIRREIAYREEKIYTLTKNI